MINSGFGIEDDYQISIRAADITGVIQASENSYIITSTSNLYEIENQKIKQTLPFNFSTITDIKEYGLFAGFSPVNGELFIISKHDLTKQLLPAFSTNQNSVKKLIHIHNTRLLVSIGSPTKAWRLDYFNSKISLSYAGSIEEEFDNFAYDPNRESIFYYKNSMIFESFFNSKKTQEFLSDDSILIFDYCPSSKKFIFHIKDKIIFTDNEGNQNALIQTYTTFSILKYINRNFIIGVDKLNDIYLFDANLLKQISKYHFSRKVDQIYLMKSEIAIISGSIIYFKKLVLPYRLWAQLKSNPVEIKRYNQKRKAARILVLSQDNNVLLFSPKTKELISSIQLPEEATTPLYDRGLYVYYQFDGRIVLCDTNYGNDRLFCPSTENGLTVYDCSTKSNLVVSQCDVNSTSIVMCEYDNQWLYCTSNLNGELLFLSMVGYNEIDRVFLSHKRVDQLLYHHRTRSIYAIFSSEINRYDFKARRVVESIAVENNIVARIHGDFLFVGFKSGAIQPFVIHEFHTFPVKINKDKFHSCQITGFSFASKFFVSCAADCHLKYWDYAFNLIADVQLPFPILTCEIMNGKRHVLVGVENAVLFIPGSSVFNQEVDIFEAKIDSFDLLDDELHGKDENDADEEDEIEKEITVNEIETDEVKKIVFSEPISFVTEPTVTQAVEEKVEEEPPPPPLNEKKKPPSRLKKKKKKKFNISAPPLKTPRRTQEKKEEKIEKIEKIEKKPPPSPKRITKLPSVATRNPRNFQRPVTTNQHHTHDLSQSNWLSVANLHQKNNRPVVQTHVFDFNADDFFGKSDANKGVQAGFTKPMSSTSHHRFPNERSFHISGNSSFSSTMKISSQSSTVKIRKIQNIHDYH